MTINIEYPNCRKKLQAQGKKKSKQQKNHQANSLIFPENCFVLDGFVEVLSHLGALL